MKLESAEASNSVKDEAETKMLGAHVEEDLYWDFKQEVTKRKESMADAITHAARMYIATVPK